MARHSLRCVAPLSVAVALVGLSASCGIRETAESRTTEAAECSSANETTRALAAIRGWCGCPSGSSSCDRTFNDQAGYIASGQPGCNASQRAELAIEGAWTHPISEGRGNARNWGGGGTAAAGGHEGWDYLVPNGTKVRAAGAGKVVFVGRSCSAGDRFCGNAWGNQVVIHHGGKTYTRYAHLAKNITVSVEQQVVAGQLIGEIGSTGASDAPHVHFELNYAPSPWFVKSNPRNAPCVADPGLLSYRGIATVEPGTVPPVNPTARPVDSYDLRRNAEGKFCAVKVGLDASTVDVRDGDGDVLVELSQGARVRVRGWIGDLASLEFRVNGRSYGVPAGSPAFLKVAFLDLLSCR